MRTLHKQNEELMRTALKEAAEAMAMTAKPLLYELHKVSEAKSNHPPELPIGTPSKLAAGSEVAGSQQASTTSTTCNLPPGTSTHN